ncbi:lipid kinase [Rubrobacter xylanophilus]|nr:lipid kinase [Rubrobacter xylanophilus]
MPDGGGAQIRKAAVVVNALSRSGEEAYARAVRLLRELGVPVEHTYALRKPERLPEVVEEVLGEGCDLLVLGGGDGSVSTAVDFLAGGETVLGLIPLGTANDFARTLEIPVDLEEACRTIACGKVVDVDLGLAGDNYFVNVATVGIGAEVTRALSPRLKKRFGTLAYPLAAVKAFFRHEPFSARLTFPEGDHEPVELERLLQVAVGNGRFYGGGLAVSPEAGMDDKRLDVYAIRLGRHRDLLGVLRYLRSGDFINQENVCQYRTRRVCVRTEPELPVNIDGEVVARTPQEFRVVPDALRVMVPRSSTAAR